MGFLRSAARGVARASSGPLSGIATPEQWVVDWYSGGTSNSAGVRVDYDTALQYSPFFAGVRVIAEDLAGMPLPVYERLEPRGKQRARSHPLYNVLGVQANPMMSAQQLRETLQGHALMWGDGVAHLVTHKRTGVIEEIWPLRPDRLRIAAKRTGPGKFSRVYQYRDEVNGIKATLLPHEVLHVPGLGFDGVQGYSVVEHAANSIGLGLATEHHGAKVFSNGSNPGGTLTHPGLLSPEARKRMADDWENIHKGIDRAHRVAILEEGVTWQQVGMPNDAAQFLETRKLQVTEMARWLRLPSHKINDLERATFSNIEQQQLDYVSSALHIWLVRWEQAILTQLFLPEERERFFAEHLVDELLRGDTAARYAAYAIGRQWGWLSANDVREKENQNPVDGGDAYLVPLNMVPAGSAPDEGEDQDDDEERGVARRYARALRGRSATGRRRIADSYAPLIAEADRTLAKAQRKAVTALVRDHLEERARGRRSTAAFLAAVETLFEGTVLEQLVELWLPVLAELAGEITVEAADEVGYEDEVDLTKWVRAYVTSHAGYQIASALGQLRVLVDGAEDTDAAAGAVRERLTKWVEERPERTAKWEANQMANAAARETWKAAGVKRLTWVAAGKNCPFCTKLDGTSTDIRKPFVAAGGEVTGLEEELNVDRDTHHPPIHPGCDCQVVPE